MRTSRQTAHESFFGILNLSGDTAFRMSFPSTHHFVGLQLLLCRPNAPSDESWRGPSGNVGNEGGQ